MTKTAEELRLHAAELDIYYSSKIARDLRQAAAELDRLRAWMLGEIDYHQRLANYAREMEANFARDDHDLDGHWRKSIEIHQAEADRIREALEHPQ